MYFVWGSTDFMRRLFIFLLVFIGFSVLAWSRGSALLEAIPTDPGSERQAVDDASLILQGQHKFGIVRYAHYPNGPSYLLLLPMRYGLTTDSSLRVVPLTFSALCFGVMALGIVRYFSNPLLMLVSLLLSASLLWQPGVVGWMGSLHQHSYALALCFAGFGLALIPGTPRWSLIALGFLNGWIGYDFTFAFVSAIITGRWLVHTRRRVGVRTVLYELAMDLAATCFGVGLAIMTHLIQNAFFFGSLRAAINDLIGSAAARAGMDIAKELNQPYVDFLSAAGASTPYPRPALVSGITREFVLESWSDMSLLGWCLQVVVIASATMMLWALVRKTGSLLSYLSLVLSVVVVTVLACVSGITWIMLMPDHARFHFHLLPRHFFVPVFLFGLGVCAVLDRISDLENRKRAVSRA